MRTAWPSCTPAGMCTVTTRLLQLSPRAAAARAVFLDDAAAPAAVGAGGHHAEHPAEPLLRDATLPAALRADDRRRSGLGAAALARLAVVLLLELDRLLRADGDFGEATARPASRDQTRAARRAPPPPPPPRRRRRRSPPKMSSNIEKMSVDVHVREVVRPSRPRPGGRTGRSAAVSPAAQGFSPGGASADSPG